MHVTGKKIGEIGRQIGRATHYLRGVRGGGGGGGGERYGLQPVSMEPPEITVSLIGCDKRVSTNQSQVFGIPGKLIPG